MPYTGPVFFYTRTVNWNGAHGNGEPFFCGQKKTNQVSALVDASPSLPPPLFVLPNPPFMGKILFFFWRQKSNFFRAKIYSTWMADTVNEHGGRAFSCAASVLFLPHDLDTSSQGVRWHTWRGMLETSSAKNQLHGTFSSGKKMPSPLSQRVDSVSRNLVRFLNHLIRQKSITWHVFIREKNAESVITEGWLGFKKPGQVSQSPGPPK